MDFAIFTFAGSSGIDDTMMALARGGMTIRGVLDRGQAAHDWAATETLVAASIELFVPRRTGVATCGKLHHKLMVIDEQRRRSPAASTTPSRRTTTTTRTSS